MSMQMKISSSDEILPDSMEFERDEGKAAANRAKHKVSLEEAKIVLDDPLYVDSRIHSHGRSSVTKEVLR